MKIILSLLTFLTITCISFAQSFYTYPGTHPNHNYFGSETLNTSDGGYIVHSIETYHDSSGGIVIEPSFNSFIMKFDYNATLQWNTQLPKSTWVTKHMFENADGSFTIFTVDYLGGGICQGFFSSFGHNSHMAKISASGQILWQNQLFGDCSHSVEAIEQLPSGNFLIASKYGQAFPNDGIEIAKIDVNGNEIFYNSISVTGPLIHFKPLFFISKDGNNHTIVGELPGNNGYHKIETDTVNGGVNASVGFTIPQNRQIKHSIKLRNGGYMWLTTQINLVTQVPEYTFMKVDNNMNYLWVEKHTKYDDIDLSNARIYEDEHERIYMGFTLRDSINAQSDVAVHVFDKNANFLYRKVVQRPVFNEVFGDLTINSHDEIILTGIENCCDTTYNTTGDVFLYFDTLQTLVNAQEIETLNDVSIFPNPTQSYIQIQTESNHTSLEFRLFDSVGRLVKAELVYNSLERIEVNTLENGIYFYQIIDDQRRIKTGKLMILK